jgi:hypothetical protein
MRTGDRGFTYLWLIFAIAIGSAAAGLAAQRWSTVIQRDQEREMIFRGHQIARAIESYRRHTPGEVPAWPMTFEQLLSDRRGPVTRHHLRRLYADPFTGRADWQRIEGEGGILMGVRSRSNRVALVTEGLTAAAGDAPPRLSDRQFMASDTVQRTPTQTGGVEHPAAGSSAP